MAINYLPMKRTNIENALNKAEEAAKGNDKSAMEAEATKLMEAAQQLAQYAAASQASGTTDASGESDVVDAEFEEVKDKDQKHNHALSLCLAPVFY